MNELQAAYRQSCIEAANEPNDLPKINELVASGKFILAEWMVHYCKRTDATIGARYSIVKVCDSRDELDRFIEGDRDRFSFAESDYGFEVFPPKPQAPVNSIVLNDEDIPF
jgi:hypothetical protein